MQLVGEEKRRAPREQTKLDTVLAIDPQTHYRCMILDINAYGARVEISEDQTPETFYLIDLLSAVAYKARAVWRQPPLMGTRFVETWALSDPSAPAWLKDLRAEVLRADGAERGIRLVWSAPSTKRNSAA